MRSLTCAARRTRSWRLAVFHLLQQGYLEMPQSVLDPKISQSPTPPDKQPELLVERLVLAYFTRPRVPGSIFNDLSNTLQGQCDKYRRQFELENLMTTPAMKLSSLYVGLAAAAIILGLGGFKLVDAVNEGRSNVGFLIAMAVVSFIVLICICVRGGLTGLGKRYLDEIQRDFSGVRVFEDKYATKGLSSNDAAFLAMGLFGAGALAASQYSYFNDAFVKAANSGSSFWAGGCGAGGGGGGCGGGGCGGGGCGGGCGGG